MEQKLTYKLVDIVKLFCSFLVVAIHTEPFRNYVWAERGFNILTRFAVPFFFVASGYFLFINGYDKKRVLHQLGRIIKLYVVWSVIYLPVLIINSIEKGNGVINALVSFFWNGTWTQFWYLAATIYAIIILYFLFPILKQRGMFILCAFLYVIGLMISTYSPLTSALVGTEVSVETRNAIFYALPYMYMGAFLSLNKEAFLYRISSVKRYALIAVFVVMLAFEALVMIVRFNTPQTVLWISLLPATALIFVSCILSKINIKFSTRAFRVCSTLIYTSHCLFQFVLNRLGIEKGMIQFISVLALSVLFSVCVYYLSKKVKYIKYLY